MNNRYHIIMPRVVIARLKVIQFFQVLAQRSVEHASLMRQASFTSGKRFIFRISWVSDFSLLLYDQSQCSENIFFSVIDAQAKLDNFYSILKFQHKTWSCK
jgi:hypothetical protein